MLPFPWLRDLVCPETSFINFNSSSRPDRTKKTNQKCDMKKHRKSSREKRLKNCVLRPKKKKNNYRHQARGAKKPRKRQKKRRKQALVKVNWAECENISCQLLSNEEKHQQWDTLGEERQEQVGRVRGCEKLATTTLLVITSRVPLIKKQLQVDAEELFSISSSSSPPLFCQLPRLKFYLHEEARGLFPPFTPFFSSSVESPERDTFSHNKRCRVPSALVKGL